MDEKNIQGYVESFKEGFVRGWVAVTSDLNKANLCDLYIDGEFISCIDANIYREDLKDALIRGGVAGFSAPIPLVFCDGIEHCIELLQVNSDLMIHSKKLKLTKIRQLVPLDENIVFDSINTPYKNNKSLLLLAGFSNQSQLLNYQKHLVKQLQLSGCYVVYIIASDEPEKLVSILGGADRVIIRRNFGYDFGSWAAAIESCKRDISMAEHIIFANDSIIGPLAPLNELFSKIEKCHTDLWAITDSKDIKYHFQSYFWGIKKKKNKHIPVIDAFFFYRCALPKDKEEAINAYEIQLFNFLISHGMSIEILFPEYDLISLAEKKFTTELKTYFNKWEYLFKVPLKKNDLNEHIFNYAKILMERQATNSSHMYWNALFESGFPFVKKELITLNPANYPFPDQFRALFVKFKLTKLINDLSVAFKSKKIL